jgi:DNA-binding transcriptional LysR family regulator
MADRKRTALDWEDIRYFLALARANTLSGAARALKVSHATVSRRISALERRLGRALFERRADGYVLNHDGERALRSALEMEESATALTAAAGDDEPAGLVRLTTVPSLAECFLIDALAAFHRKHPRVRVEMLVEARNLSLARRDADIAIRLSRPKDSALVGRKVAALGYEFYASPGTARNAPFIAPDRTNDFTFEAKWIADHFKERTISFTANSVAGRTAAARAGFGIALLPKLVGEADSKLEAIACRPRPPARDIWLLTPRNAIRNSLVRLAIDSLTEIFRVEAKRLSGGRA